MADGGGFDTYFHVPQQSRRDKLRDFMAQNHPQPLLLHGSSALFPPFYDHHHPSIFPSSSPMDGLGSSSSTSPSASYLDSTQVAQVPPSYLVNPSSNNPFLYTPQNLGHGSSSSSLSLSLSSHYSNASTLPLYGSGPYEEKTVTWSGEYAVVNPSGSTSYEASRSPVPLGPFTGYASILRGSKFLKPAQELLEQLVYEDHQKGSLDVSVMDPPDDHCLVGGGWMGDDPFNGGRKSKLISMLEEVYKRYRQLYQQIQAVAASFECVAGLGNATPYANLALKALSKHFKAVKIAITEQLQSANNSHGQVSHVEDESAKDGNPDKGPCRQKSMNCAGFLEQRPVWRPQRGLPERAVAVLRNWLFDHFLHPYPTDTDKIMLASQTGLSRNQVSNWFINARVRLWKPMVEEIHMLESRQAPVDSRIGELNANRPREQVQPLNHIIPSHSPAQKQGIQDVPPPKYSITEHPDLPFGGGEHLYYNDLPSQSHAGQIANSTISGGRVSLSLGLHQNTALASEPYPVAAARRIGLGNDANAQGFNMGSYESHNRQFGREDDIGSQLFG